MIFITFVYGDCESQNAKVEMKVWANPEPKGSMLADLIEIVICVHFNNQRNKDQPQKKEDEDKQDRDDYAHSGAKLYDCRPEKE